MINFTFPVIKAIKSKGCCIFFLAATSNSLCLGFLKHDLTLKTETTSSRVSIRQVLPLLRRLQRNFRLFAFVMWAVDYLLHKENMRWVNNFFSDSFIPFADRTSYHEREKKKFHLIYSLDENNRTSRRGVIKLFLFSLPAIPVKWARVCLVNLTFLQKPDCFN